MPHSDIEELRDLVVQVRTTVIGAPPLYHIYREELHQQLAELGISIGSWWTECQGMYFSKCPIGDRLLVIDLCNELRRFGMSAEWRMPAAWQSETVVYNIFDRIATMCSKLDVLCHFIGQLVPAAYVSQTS